MTQRTVSNLPMSVHRRLVALSKERQEEPTLIARRFAMERLLYRLSRSPHARQFVLKGGMLLALWSPQSYRVTRDLDLLGFGQPSQERLLELFRSICQATVEPDGLVFDALSVRVAPIGSDEEYLGVRVRLRCILVKAPIDLQADVGFGDAVMPEPLEMQYPTLLDFPAPRLRVYPPEAVIAEKLHAMVELGMLNSRLKDYYDIWTLSRLFEFDASRLAAAIRATFARRETALPGSVPPALTAEFANDAERAKQWTAFLRRTHLPQDTPRLEAVNAAVRDFLMPVLSMLARGLAPSGTWPAGGPWSLWPTQ